MTKPQFNSIMLATCAILLLQFYVLPQKPKTFDLLTPLELAGLHIYQREGCIYCHSRVVRPLRDEHARYGEHSSQAELAFFRDKTTNRVRIGPDLARVGDKYSDDWLVKHLLAPRSQIKDSNMPAYPWLNKPLNIASIQPWMQQHPYPEAYIAYALSDIPAQLATPDTTGKGGLITRYQTISKPLNIRNFDKQAGEATELDALIAYLQSLDMPQ